MCIRLPIFCNLLHIVPVSCGYGVNALLILSPFLWPRLHRVNLACAVRFGQTKERKTTWIWGRLAGKKLIMSVLFIIILIDLKHFFNVFFALIYFFLGFSLLKLLFCVHCMSISIIVLRNIFLICAGELPFSHLLFIFIPYDLLGTLR